MVGRNLAPGPEIFPNGATVEKLTSKTKMKTLILSVSLLIAISSSLCAKTIKYPEYNPSFSITLPDDWTTKANSDGSLEGTTGDGSQFSFMVNPAYEVSADAGLKAYLPKFVQEMSDSAGIKDMKVDAIKETMTSKGVKLFGLSVSGATDGGEMLISLTAFAPKTGTYFIIMAADRAEVEKAHEKVMGEILSSIASIAGGNAK